MWILVTMGRAAKCQEVLQNMINAGVSTPGIVIVNGPDDLDGYKSLTIPDQWSIVFLPENIGFCAAVNRVIAELPNEQWYGLCTDDEHVFTPGYDLQLIEAAGQWCYAYGNDGIPSKPISLHGYCVIGGDLIRTVGYWGLPGIFHAYSDWGWQQIAATFGLARFQENIKVEHRATYYGACDSDATHEKGFEHVHEDAKCLMRWLREDWQSVFEKIDAELPQYVRISNSLRLPTCTQLHG